MDPAHCLGMHCARAPRGAVSIRRQARVWESNYTLFERAVEVAPANVTAAINFGVELQRRERYQDALALPRIP